jgi:hypothetical protein
LWAKKDGSNNLSFGISKSSTASNVNYTPFSYVIGTTYLIVIKYNFVAASTNDTEDLFINPSIGVSEPTPTISTSPADNATADLTALQSFCLRQGSTSGSIQKIDGIRVATTWAEAVAPSYTLPVATPTFSVCPGFYLTAPQTVAMSSTTVGASIYYTTDKTTPVYPASGSTILYDGTPLSVSATTTIKAIAYLDGSTLSNVSTGIFTFPELIPSISTLRTADPAGFYKLTSTAVITYQAVNATGKPRFIQDETAGIMLYDGNAKTITNQYSLYDGLTNIVGTLTTNQGMLEFVPYVDPGAATSTSNTITAKEVAPDKLGENIGQLVKVKNVTITGTGNFVGSTSYVITDGTLNAKIRTQYAVADLPYIGTAIPTTTQDITGVVNIYNTTETDLVPRTAVDMSTVTAISQPSTAMKIGVNNGQLMFVAQAGESVVVYNVTGQKIISQVTVTGRNAVTVSARGVVFIKIGYQTTKVLL